MLERPIWNLSGFNNENDSRFFSLEGVAGITLMSFLPARMFLLPYRYGCELLLIISSAFLTCSPVHQPCRPHIVTSLWCVWLNMGAESVAADSAEYL